MNSDEMRSAAELLEYLADRLVGIGRDALPDLAAKLRAMAEGTEQRTSTTALSVPPWQPIGETKRQPDPMYEWKGDGPAPKKWIAEDGTLVYRSIEDFYDG